MEDVELYGLTTQSGITTVRRDVASRLSTKNEQFVNDPLSIEEDSTIDSMPSQTSINDIVCSIPSLTYTATWDTTLTAGTYLSDLDVKPNIMFGHTESVGGHSLNFVTMTPLGMMSNLFGFYRGDIKVVMKLSKTTFHSGCLAIMFKPKNKGMSNISNTTSKDLSFERIIWNIHEADSIEFVCPYTAISPWLPVNKPYGSIAFEIINPLVCPATVNGTIDIAIEFYGTPSLEFAFPVRNYLRPYCPLTFQSGLEPVRDQVNYHINAQSHKVFSFDGRTSPSPKFNKRCIGENIFDLRQLLQRYNTWFNIEPQSTTGELIDIQPYQVSMNYLASGGYVDVCNGMPNVHDLIITAFCLMQGSAEFKSLTGNTSYQSGSQAYANEVMAVTFYVAPSMPGWQVPPSMFTTETDVTTGSWLANTCGANLAYSRTDINGGIEIRVPQYHYDSHRAIMSHTTSGNGNVLTDGYGGTSLTCQLKVEGMESIKVFRRFSKNFSLRDFISFGTYAVTASS